MPLIYSRQIWRHGESILTQTPADHLNKTFLMQLCLKYIFNCSLQIPILFILYHADY